MIEQIYQVFVPSGLILLMFGMGLQLVAEDWIRITRYPLAVLAGFLGQFLLLPAIAFTLVHFLSLPLAVSAGVIIVAACPGGVVSNSVSFLARADVALSVTLTAISSVIALVTLPVLLELGLQMIQHDLAATSLALPATETITLPLAATIRQLLILVLLPLGAGMLLRRFAPGFAQRSDRWLRPGSVVVLLVLLLGAVGLEFGFFLDNFRQLWPVLLALNLASAAGGYWLARLLRLDLRQSRTVAIEVGIQNVALGVSIALNLLHQPEWMVVPSVYSIVMMLTAFGLIAGISLRNSLRR